MLTYKYVAKDPNSGETIKAEMQADSEQAVSAKIVKLGYSPVSIKLNESTASPLAKFRNRVKSKDRVLFSRQLSTLLNAGLPLVQSLRSVGDQTTSKPLRIVISNVIASVEGGSTLSAALSKYPRVFNQIYISLVEAGEASGTLDKALERLAIQQEKDAEIVSKVRGAMIYPMIVVFVMILVIGFMIVKVLPQVKVLYDGLQGAQLPLVTRILLAISDFIIARWYFVLIILGILAFITSRWARTLGGKRVIDKLKMRAWPVGPLFMKMYMARFSRTGTTLVASGVPLIQVLTITADAVNNMYVGASLKKAIEKVRGGKSLADALTNDPNFLPLVPNMIRIGEQSGAIEKMLGKTADYYEREVDDQIKAIQTIIEPVLMVMLGVMAFVIVSAVLLPIYSLAGKTFIR